MSDAYMAISPSGVVEEVGVDRALPENMEHLVALFKGGYSLVWIDIDESHGRLFQTVSLNIEDTE